MNKKKNLIISMLIIMAINITACTRLIPFPKHDIHTSYKEWAEQIGLYSTEYAQTSCYEADNEIDGGFVNEGEIAAYKEACDIINAHNKFVEENPDYFPVDIKISFDNRFGDSVPWNSLFFNAYRDDIRIEWIQELGRQNTAKIQYMWIYLRDASNEIEKNDDIKIDVPVVILDFNGIKSVKYDFLDEFLNAEQVIINHYDHDGTYFDYDKEAECQLIKQHLPNVKIYNVFFDEQQKEYHLEQLQ